LKLKCSYCGNDNNTIEKCFKRIKSEGSREIAEVALMTICEDGTWDGEDQPYYKNEEDSYDKIEYCSLSCEQDIKMEHNTMEVDPNMWIMDSGSTSHMRSSKTGMTNLVQWKAPITLGKRQHIFSELKVTFKGQVFSEKGILFSVTMDDVLYVPELMIIYSL
jgi:hypothetical protein